MQSLLAMCSLFPIMIQPGQSRIFLRSQHFRILNCFWVKYLLNAHRINIYIYFRMLFFSRRGMKMYVRYSNPFPTDFIFYLSVIWMKSHNGAFWSFWVGACPCSAVRSLSGQSASPRSHWGQKNGAMPCPYWERRLWCIAWDVAWQESSIYRENQEPRNTWIKLPRLNRALSTSVNLLCDHSPSVSWHTSLFHKGFTGIKICESYEILRYCDKSQDKQMLNAKQQLTWYIFKDM